MVGAAVIDTAVSSVSGANKKTNLAATHKTNRVATAKLVNKRANPIRRDVVDVIIMILFD